VPDQGPGQSLSRRGRDTAGAPARARHDGGPFSHGVVRRIPGAAASASAAPIAGRSRPAKKSAPDRGRRRARADDLLDVSPAAAPGVGAGRRHPMQCAVAHPVLFIGRLAAELNAT